jgi:riboflavin synthase
MFTGIVKGLFQTQVIRKLSDLTQVSIMLTDELISNLSIGHSVAVNGVCLTVVKIDGPCVWFDVIDETLSRTNLRLLEPGNSVNIELSARFGDPIGGHILSGHVLGTSKIKTIESRENHRIITFNINPEWIKYFFRKGYIALDGASLTLVSVDPLGEFSVHVIPETLRLTTLGTKKTGSLVNIEIDSLTQMVVDTVERLLKV